MPTELMRTNLRQIFNNCTSAHAGLLIQRGLKTWEDGEKPTKKALINDKITNVQADDLYKLAFKRWLQHTHAQPHIANVSATVEGRLFTGLPLGGSLETGVTTHHTYGMPLIAGSSIKGAVRHYAEHLFAKREDGKVVYDKDEKVVLADGKQDLINVLFGSDDDKDPSAGYFIWHDAWWIPPAGGVGVKPYVGEVVTVHHQSYYNGDINEALGMENPVPNQQVGVQGSFYFSVECVNTEQGGAWTKYVEKLLKATLEQQGIGSKVAAGYGYFEMDDKVIIPYCEYIEAWRNTIQTASMSAEERVIHDFVKGLEGQTSWQGKPNVDCGFLEFYNEVKDWNDKAMLQQALDALKTKGKEWQGKALNTNKKWKDRLKELEAKIN